MRQPYIDFAFYQDEYGGSADEADVARLRRKASAEIDRLTFGRIDQTALDRHMDDIRCAACAVLDAFLVNESGGGIAEESNDGIRVSYVAGVSKAKTDDGRIYDAALRHLAGTSLMYRGE